MLNLVSWNLNANPRSQSVDSVQSRLEKCLRLLKRQLGTKPETILVLQEVSDSQFSRIVIGEFAGSFKVASRSAKHHVLVAYGSAFEEVKASIVEQPLSISVEARVLNVNLRRERDGKALSVFGLHLPDRHNYGDRARWRAAEAYALRIRDEWDGRSDAVIAGDFNDNPYDVNVFGRSSFFALREPPRTLSRPPRGSDGKPALFNPAWACLPFDSDRPRGTFQLRGSDIDALEWHVFDQVLASPSLAATINVEILSKIGGTNLVDTHFNIKTDYSDHLPLHATIDWG